MSPEERAKTAARFGRLVAQLKAEETLQIYVDARPVNLAGAAGRRAGDEVQASAGPAPTREQPARDAMALSQWRLYAALEESLSLHADEQAAVQVSAYVVVPYLPRQTRRPRGAGVGAAQPAARGAARAPACRRTAARCASTSRTSTRCAPSSRPTGMTTDLLDGEQVLQLLWARFNPTKADSGRPPAPPRDVEVLGELDAPATRRRPRRGAALRAQIARSSLDSRTLDHQHVDGRPRRRADDLRAQHRRAARRWAGCTGAMLTRQPFTLSVFVHALDRRRERQKLKLAYRRMFTINRGAEQRGRVPDFDRYVQEREYEQLLGEMAGRRARQPVPRLDLPDDARPRPATRPGRAVEAVDFCAESIEAVGDCKVNRGEFRQHELWPSSLPLGRDVARHGAQVRDRATPPTRFRSSAPRAARRPGSRSRSPTRAAPSSCSTRTTPSTPTTRC